MSGSGSSSNDSGKKQAIAFGQQVKQTVPKDHLNNSIPCDEGRCHNPLYDSRCKKVPVTVIYSQEPHLGEPPDLPVKAKLQSPQSCNQSEIKIVQVWSMAIEKGSNSVDNSHQYSNPMEQVSQIIPVDNSSNIGVSQTVQTQEGLAHSAAVAIRTNWEGKAPTNKYVANSSEKTTDNKATRLARRRERRNNRYKTDPEYAQHQRERQRERRKDAAYAKRLRDRLRERYQTDPDYAERERKRKRERYQTDPAVAEREKKRRKERQQADPDYAERERKRKRERYHRNRAEHLKERKKQYCQSVNSAKTQAI